MESVEENGLQVSNKLAMNGSNNNGSMMNGSKKNGSMTNGSKKSEKNGVKYEHPLTLLKAKSTEWNIDILDEDFAKNMDAEPTLRSFRNQFHVPKMKELPHVDLSSVNGDEDCLYFAGNSLGLQPKAVKDKIDRELQKWAKTGVHGHLGGEMPWAHCDECVEEEMARVVGAKRAEVTVMNGLTVNLHQQLITFYRPTPTRHKILLEAHSFPSDHYAIESQIRFHGYKPEDSMVCMEPRKGEECIREEDILSLLKTEGDSIAVVLFSGVQYYTGQLFDIKTITTAAHEQGCYVGWDLAHAAGNVELELHDWDVDFACWCSYKYMNTGAGGISGFFIHERLFDEAKKFPRMVGWWSHKMSTRFQMNNELELDEGARGFRISNPPFLLCASLEASLDVFAQTSMKELRKKSTLLTCYLEMLLKHYYPMSDDPTVQQPHVEIITPSEPERRGAQLSASFNVSINQVFKQLQKRGVVCDKREPHVLRLAPAPLYNTFHDVYKFVHVLGEAMNAAHVTVENGH